MARSTRTILLAVVGLAALVIVAAAGLRFLVDAGLYKSRLEASASQALGMNVAIGGRVGIGFSPGLVITLGDVRVRNGAMDVASIKEVRLEIDVLTLLKREVRIEKIALQDPRITIDTDREGRSNLTKPNGDAGTLPVLDWPNVSLSNATLLYADPRLGEGFEARRCQLDMHRLRLSGGKRAEILKDLSLTATLRCGELRRAGFTASDLNVTVAAMSGVFDLDPVTMRVFGSPGSGSIRADFSGIVPLYRIRYALTQFPIEDFFKFLSPRTVATGRMNVSANLTMQGDAWKQLRQSAAGQISLEGKNLVLSGSDLDREFSRFEASQNFNLVDVGAVFLAGPLGLLVTKGYNFASMLQGTGGSSEIRTLVSNWKVARGVAQAQDVAMATQKNRVALQGGLDFVNDQFNDVTVALVDPSGCALVRQKIHGTFQNPAVENPNVLLSLTGPALTLLRKGSDLVRGKKCDVFYAGSVAAPK